MLDLVPGPDYAPEPQPDAGPSEGAGAHNPSQAGSTPVPATTDPAGHMPIHDPWATDPAPLPVRARILRADAQVAASAARRAAFIDHLNTGASIGDTCRHIGIARGTYDNWRTKHRDFAATVDMVKQAVRSAADPWDGTFASFRLKFFGLRSFHHHLKIVDVLENAKPMSVAMVLCPPEHGKTTCIEDFICYRIALDPNIRITVVSEGQGHAKKIISRVQRRMTDMATYPDFIARFGPFYTDGQERKGKPWTSEFFTVTQADHDERDYTLEARGSTSAIAGTRVDLLIFDDIQSRKNLSRTKTLVETIRQDFLTRPGRQGRTVFVGTRVDVGDVYEELQDQGIVDRLVQLPATDHGYDARGNMQLVEQPCPLSTQCDVPDIPHETPLCPEMWDTHSLAKRRKQVTDGPWWRNFQQRPQLAGDATFSDELITKAWDVNRRVAPPDLTVHPAPLVALGLDPALGGGNAVIAAALHPTKLDVLDCHTASGLGTIQGVVAQVDHFAYTYRPSLIVVETDTHQKGIARSEELAAVCRTYGCRVVEHRTSGEKADPVLGVAMMAGGFARGDITLPSADDYATRRMAPLVAELRAWRHDIATKKLQQDLVMALWFVWKYWMETRGRGDHIATVGPRRGTPWKPTPFRPAVGLHRRIAG